MATTGTISTFQYADLPVAERSFARDVMISRLRGDFDAEGLTGRLVSSLASNYHISGDLDLKYRITGRENDGVAFYGTLDVAEMYGLSGLVGSDVFDLVVNSRNNWVYTILKREGSESDNWYTMRLKIDYAQGVESQPPEVLSAVGMFGSFLSQQIILAGIGLFQQTLREFLSREHESAIASYAAEKELSFLSDGSPISNSLITTSQ